MKTYEVFKKLRPFLLLWSTQTLSELGTAMTNYALVIWAYQQTGTASSVSLLTLSSFLPTILLRFIGGTLADRWNKKHIMLICDLCAATGTLLLLILHSLKALQIWHLYLINALLSCMNAVQVPASFTATSLLVHKEHYTRISGLQGFSGAAVSILAPALGGALLSFGGMNVVLLCDIASFSVAIMTLLFFIRIPKLVADGSQQQKNSFWTDCLDGLRHLIRHRNILRITLFMAAVNFLAKLGNDGMLAPFILSRTGNNEQILGLVQSSVSAGLLAGSLLLTVLKPAKDKHRLAYATCTFIYIGVIVQSLTTVTWVWCAAAFFSYLAAAVMNANLTSALREEIPLHMHGRVFSAKDTLQNITIPLGLFLGGVLADHVFQPLMAAQTPLQQKLSPLFGSGSGAGIALQFFIVGTLGVVMCLTQLIAKSES